MAFELLDAMKGINYPEKTVTVYLDYAALEQIVELEDQASRLAAGDDELNDALLAEQNALREQVEASAININLRGLPRSVINAITRHIEATVKDPTERQNQTNQKVMVRSIASISNSEGELADTNEDEIAEFLEALPSNVWVNLMRAMSEINFSAREYEGKSTDPNFS